MTDLVTTCSTVWRPGRPVHLAATLGTLRRGRLDPAYRVEADGAVWRTLRAPSGPATLRLRVREGAGEVLATAWGAGAAWAVESVPALLGAGDDVEGFEPRHPVVREGWRRHQGWRVPRTGLVLEALVPAVLEQKVSGAEARGSWARLLRLVGEPAPGPAPDGMRVPPPPRVWAGVASWDWHRCGVDGKRSRTVLRAVAVAHALERTAAVGHAEADRVLQAVPGIGPWTSAEVRQRAHGDPDAVSVGDYNLPALVGCALTGAPVDDDGMLELLEPYAGHRYRAVRMIELSAARPGRRAPRARLRDYRAI